MICDRYLFSTVAYQALRGITPAEIYAAHDSALRPDLLIVVAVPVALARIAKRGGGADAFERENALRQIRESFATMCAASPSPEQARIVTVGTVARVAEQILEHVLA